MIQLIFHLIGDYVLQSDWMANNKRKDSAAAISHAFAYSALFWFLAVHAHNPYVAMAVIWGTHFLIDRFGLARYVVFAKNFIAPGDYPKWKDCKATGYPSERPAWLAVWLLIAADNTIHLAINYAALRWL